jgi:hypothetical protein
MSHDACLEWLKKAGRRGGIQQQHHSLKDAKFYMFRMLLVSIQLHLQNS